MKRHLLVAALLATSLAPACAWAETAAAGPADAFVGGSADAGTAKAAVCAACHGPNGNSTNPEWPKLSGQHASYVYTQLQAFKSGQRVNPIMQGQVAGMSDQDMKDVAAHFARQDAQPGVASQDAVAVAQKLYRAGDTKRGLAACSACHGPQGLGNAAAKYPRIGGQHAKYVTNRLADFRSKKGVATDSLTRQMMSEIAAKLTDAEIAALASYVNGLQ